MTSAKKLACFNVRGKSVGELATSSSSHMFYLKNDTVFWRCSFANG